MRRFTATPPSWAGGAYYPRRVAEVEKSLEGSELVGDWTKEHTETVTAETDAYTADATLEVVENSEVLERFVNLRHRTDNDTVTLPEDGVILTEKLSLLLDVEVGDTITLDGDSRVEVRVADITEHYIQHSVYMSSTYYEQVFGQTPEENAVLVSYDTQADAPRSWSRSWSLWTASARLPASRTQEKPSAPAWRAWTTRWR